MCIRSLFIVYSSKFCRLQISRIKIGSRRRSQKSASCARKKQCFRDHHCCRCSTVTICSTIFAVTKKNAAHGIHTIASGFNIARGSVFANLPPSAPDYGFPATHFAIINAIITKVTLIDTSSIGKAIGVCFCNPNPQASRARCWFASPKPPPFLSR